MALNLGSITARLPETAGFAFALYSLFHSGQHVPRLEGSGLALSGGGYRASLFHLGVTRRLHELRILQKLDKLSSVSGGSILAGHLAERMLRQDSRTRLSFDDWETEVSAPFRKFVQFDLRSRLVLRYFGWNAFSPRQRADALSDAFWYRITRRRLGELPKAAEGIQFIFLATDFESGVSWPFTSEGMGSYTQSRKYDSKEISVARAMAASACFPPVFGPIKLELGKSKVAYLTDGGVYDNSGMEPIWKKSQMVLVSDAGAPLNRSVPKMPLARLLRYSNIAMDQVRAQRQRALIRQLMSSKHSKEGQVGALWRIGSRKESFLERADAIFNEEITDHARSWYGYDPDIVDELITQFRTDLDYFTTAESKILENHGYYIADIAVRRHLRREADFDQEFSPPHPDFLQETIVRESLKRSHSRWVPVRRWHQKD